MSSYPTALELIVRRFPEVESNEIVRLYGEDATFYEICQDYAECIQMRARYADDPLSPDASRYESDYARLIEALEAEMRAILMGTQPRSVRAAIASGVEPPSSDENDHLGRAGHEKLSSIQRSFHSRFTDQEEENR